MLKMENKQEGKIWILDDDIKLTSPGATDPPNFFSCKTIPFPYCINCLELGFCYLEPNSSYPILRLGRETPFQ